jgi:hypothetical protein
MLHSVTAFTTRRHTFEAGDSGTAQQDSKQVALLKTGIGGGASAWRSPGEAILVCFGEQGGKTSDARVVS